MKMSKNKKERFYAVYSNLPLSLREEIIVVVNKEPITWKLAKLYIDEETKLGKTILEKLDALKII